MTIRARPAPRLSAAVLAACAAAVPGTAGALDFTEHVVGKERVLLVSGEFEKSDGKRFLRAVETAQRVDEVWLASPGGSAMAGLEIGRHIRRIGLPTRVPKDAYCTSACAYAFLGGVFRAADGRIGVHMSSLSNNPEIVAEVTLDIRRRGVTGAKEIVARVEQLAAITMAAQAKYLVEMSVSLELMTPITRTDHDDIHWLTASELRKYNVINQ